MFHFELVHVPGTHHSPDGLSRRRPQPGDEPEPNDDFDDWIDDINGFIHMINPLPIHMSTLTDAPPTTCFITDNTQDESQEPDEPKPEEEETPVNYDIVH